MTRILIIRHGDTIYNKETIFRGTLDVPLSDVGREQARLTGLELSGERLARVVSSPLSRALDTARAVAAPHGLEPETDTAFIDLDFGEWQGRSRDEVAAAEPSLFSNWLRDPGSVRFPGGETLEVVRAAACARLDALVRESGGETFALATHRVVVKLLVLHALGMPVSGFWRIAADTCGITTFTFDPEIGYILKHHNHTAHLAPLKGKMTTKDF